jgi:hypothetical protein
MGILLFTMMFGQPPFHQNDPERSPLLPFMCSNNLEMAEVFFQNHDLTRRFNE